MLRTWEGCKHLHIRDSEWAPGFQPIWGNEPVNGGPLYLCLIIKKQKCSNTSLPLQKELQHFIWPFDSFRTKDGMSISLQSRLPYVDTGIRTHHKIECVKTGLVRAASDKITQWPSGCVITSNEQGLCLSCMDFFFLWVMYTTTMIHHRSDNKYFVTENEIRTTHQVKGDERWSIDKNWWKIQEASNLEERVSTSLRKIISNSRFSRISERRKKMERKQLTIRIQ